MNKKKILSFTLLELLIVLSIISIVFFVVTPRFIGTINPRRFRSFVIRLQKTLQYLNETAVVKKRVYFFVLEVDKRQYSFRVSEEGNPEGTVHDRMLVPVAFPNTVDVAEIEVIPGGRVNTGRVMIPFTPDGLLFSFKIVFIEGEKKKATIIGNSVNGKFEIREGEEAE